METPKYSIGLHKSLLLLFLAIYIISLLATPAAVNATDVSGHISQDTVWTLAGSPYRVTSDLIIDPGATLAIEAGVRVEVMDGVNIIVNGSLIVQGEPGNEVTFTSGSSNPQPGAWGTILFIGGNDETLLLNNTRILYAQYGVTIESRGEAYILDSAIESSSMAGIKTLGVVDVSIHSSLISGAPTGVESVDGDDNKAAGVSIYDTYIEAYDKGVYILVDELFNAYIFNYTIQNSVIKSGNNSIAIYAYASDSHGISDVSDVYIIGNNMTSDGDNIVIYGDSGWSTRIYRIKIII